MFSDPGPPHGLEEALEILKRAEPGRAQRIGRLLDQGYPAYTTTPGWLGYRNSFAVHRPSGRW